MQTSVETIGNLERRITFQLPAGQLEGEVGGRLREIARTARIKGFRPGKVPAKVIEQRYGDQVRAEALDGLLRETFNNAVREQDLQLAGNPRIEKQGEGELEFVATFEVVPDFGDVDVTKLTVVRNTAEVTDADIDQMIENLRLDPKRVNETLRLIASTYEEPEQVVEMYRNDPQLMQGLQNRVMEEQVIDWIAERAQHTEVPLSFQDAIRG